MHVFFCTCPANPRTLSVDLRGHRNRIRRLIGTHQLSPSRSQVLKNPTENILEIPKSFWKCLSPFWKCSSPFWKCLSPFWKCVLEMLKSLPIAGAQESHGGQSLRKPIRFHGRRCNKVILLLLLYDSRPRVE